MPQPSSKDLINLVEEINQEIYSANEGGSYYYLSFKTDGSTHKIKYLNKDVYSTFTNTVETKDLRAFVLYWMNERYKDIVMSAKPFLQKSETKKSIKEWDLVKGTY